MPPTMPNFVRGLVVAGLDALRGVPSQLAAWQLQPGAHIDASLSSPEALATALLDALKYPEHVFDRLPPDAQDRVAVALGLPRRDDWRAPPEDPTVPDHLQPSWERDVCAVLFLRERAPTPPSLRSVLPRTSHARAWPELRSLDAWSRAREHASALTAELARALGADWSPAAPTRSGLPSIVSTTSGIALVAIPGGTYEMGLPPRRTSRAHAARAQRRTRSGRTRTSPGLDGGPGAHRPGRALHVRAHADPRRTHRSAPRGRRRGQRAPCRARDER